VLTVSILINGHPIHTRSVVNRLDELGAYVCDDGTLIEHDPADGAVALAIKALCTIHEVPPRRGKCGSKGLHAVTAAPFERRMSGVQIVGTVPGTVPASARGFQ
jgi:hypothetical protein